MNCAAEVDNLVKTWISQGQSKTYIVVNTAKAELDWAYVWGAVGAECTPDKRRYYMGRSQIGEKDRENIKKSCPVLNGSQSACAGCKWLPGGNLTLINDCQGFVKQVFSKIGISFAGGGCTSMWNNDSNWTEKGTKAQMPNKVCLVFQWNGNNQTMQHVGIHIGDGVIIECATTVRYNNTSKSAWTHYAMPKGLDDMPVVDRPTLRKGSTGDWVVLCQEDLLTLGYDLSPYGADGKYGNKTVQAVKKFQTDYDIKPYDGICGQKTWNGLIEYAEKPSPTTKLYTVHIPHQTEEQYEKLKALYPDAYKTEE